MSASGYSPTVPRNLVRSYEKIGKFSAFGFADDLIILCLHGYFLSKNVNVLFCLMLLYIRPKEPLLFSTLNYTWDILGIKM
jgi:hypothetical protein